MGQYRKIQGISYERDLLDFGETCTARGRMLAKADAERLWEMAMDGNKVTPTERRTLKYLMDNFRMHEAAKAVLRDRLSQSGVLSVGAPASKKSSGSYYKTINGISYDRKLLEEAQSMAEAQGGVLTFANALHLWGKANDGAGITPTERRTLQQIATQHQLEAEAHQFFEKSLGLRITPSLTNGAGRRSVEDKPGFFTSLWRRFMGKRPASLALQDSDSLPSPQVAITAPPAEPQAKRQRMDVPQPPSTNCRSAPEHSVEAIRDAGSSTSRGRHCIGSDAAGSSQGAAAAFTESRSVEQDLKPELQELLAWMNGQAGGRMPQIELPEEPRKPEDLELAAQRAKAAVEVERILSARNAADVLGHGMKDDQRREFKRLALLLHPDKGFVDHDDPRAALAMRLAMAALSRSRQVL